MLPLKYSVRNVIARPGTTAMTVLAIGLVTGVFVAIQALAGGLTSTLQRSGDDRTLILLRPGAESEGQSSLSPAAFEATASNPAIATTADGRPLASPEVLVAMFVAREDGRRANVIIRGVRPAAFDLRPEVKIVGGRALKPGVAELIVGRRIAERFPAFRLGKTVDLGRRDYPIVGLFEADGGATESEVLGDADAIMGDFQRGGFSAARMKVAPGADVEKVIAEIKGDKRFNLEAKTEAKYLEAQTQGAEAIYWLGRFISAILAVGAIFATMNTLYAAVAARTREIATLRAVGFGRASILGTFLIEAVLMAVIGWAVAILVARLALHGTSTGTTNFVTFSEIAFDFRVDGAVAMRALVLTALIGAAGGLLPAIRATRIPVSQALRQV